MSATAEIIYIDATTGDPLLFIKDLQINDPLFACFSPLDSWQLANQSKQILLYIVALLASAAYLIVAFVIVLRFYKPQTLPAGTLVS